MDKWSAVIVISLVAIILGVVEMMESCASTQKERHAHEERMELIRHGIVPDGGM